MHYVVSFCSPFRKNWFILPTLVGSREATFTFHKLIPPGSQVSLWLHRETNTHSHTHTCQDRRNLGCFYLPTGSGCQVSATALRRCSWFLVLLPERVRGNGESNVSSFISFNSSASSAREGMTQPEERGRPASAQLPWWRVCSALGTLLGDNWGLASEAAFLCPESRGCLCGWPRQGSSHGGGGGAAGTASFCRKEGKIKLGQNQPFVVGRWDMSYRQGWPVGTGWSCGSPCEGWQVCLHQWIPLGVFVSPSLL